MSEAALTAQNWEAFLQIDLRHGEARTQLLPRRRYGPLTVQRPFYPEGERCHVYLLHPPGGIVGGDRLDLRVALEQDAQSLITTPGAAKFYLSAGDTAQVRQHFSAAAGAELEFLPQENIYFPGAIVHSETTVDVESGSRVILWEKHCFGRPANDEFFDHGRLLARLRLTRDGEPRFSETQRIDAAEIMRPSGLRGYPACGSLLVYGITLETEQLRTLQNIDPPSGSGGLTQIEPDLVIARSICETTRDLDDYFLQLWAALRPALLARAADHPRIWST